MARLRVRLLAEAISLGMFAGLTVWGLWLLVPQTLNSWEEETYDARLRWRGGAPVSPHLVIIGRDADSDARFGVGLWDRARFARLITALGQAGASLVVVDFHFAGASPPERGGPQSDAALNEATAQSANVVYPLMISLRNTKTSPATPTLDPAIAAALASTVPKLDVGTIHALPHVGSVSAPLPVLLRNLKGLGHVGALSDADGAYRRLALYVDAGGQPIPALSLAVATAFLQIAPSQIAFRPGQAIVLRDAHRPDGRRQALSLPIDAQGRVLIDYAGRWDAGPFPYFSFVDVWDAIEEGRHEELRAQVAGKIVVIMHAGLEADKRRTPLELKAPGGFIHANAINTILMGRGLRAVSAPLESLVVLLLAAGAAALLLVLPGWSGIGLVALLGMGYLGLSQLLLTLGGIVLPVVAPLGGWVLASGLAAGWSGRAARSRIHDLEKAIMAVQRSLVSSQDALARHETCAEGLEEDLAAARMDAAVSAEEQRRLAQEDARLRDLLAAAQGQVEVSRREVRTLESKLATLSAAAGTPARLSDAELERLRAECGPLGILTHDPGVLRVFRDVKKAARARTPVLLLGETGTGKELFARAAHLLSARQGAPFVAVNVAAIAPDVVESELFGHVKGAFTGADRERKGYFEQADRGTLFLDEIGDLRPDVQAKLLRVLHEGSFYRVGATSLTRVDVRVVAATNKDLAQGVAQGWFREDLYFRLRGIQLRLPPLRARTADLSLLAQHFVQDAAKLVDRDDATLSQGALEALERWPWPGNVRELKQCLEQAVVLAEGPVITERDLRLERAPAIGADGGKDAAPLADDVSGDRAVLDFLRRHAFDMQATAHTLGWDRSTVTQRLKGLCFQALVQSNGDRHTAAAALAGERSLVRIVDLKLAEYYEHLVAVVQNCHTVEDAITVCRKRFKNLPERYLPAVASLVRQVFAEKLVGQP